MLNDINRRVNHLKVQWQIFNTTDKRPRVGCVETDQFIEWQCCEFHRSIGKKHQQMRENALEITFFLFPYCQQAQENPNIVRMEKNLVSCLSPKWWHLIEKKLLLLALINSQ